VSARGGHGFAAEPARALWAGSALAALFAAIALAIPASPLAVDQSWSELMHDIQTPALERLALVFNYLGRGLGRALSLVTIGIVLLVARRWAALVAFAIVESVTPLVSATVKALVDRPRPPGALIHASSSSFPSGHAAYAGATAVALVLLFTAPGRGRRPSWVLAALAIAGMAWSRTYLQVHWLSDVIAGSLLGIAVTALVFGARAPSAARPPLPPFRQLPAHEDHRERPEAEADRCEKADHAPHAAGAPTGRSSTAGAGASCRRRRNLRASAATTIEQATTMQISHWWSVRLVVSRIRLNTPSSVPNTIAAADIPVAIRKLRSSRMSRLKTERRSSRHSSEKNTLAIANVVKPIVRATAALP
jgi:undecaprenyl-diphosphatase